MLINNELEKFESSKKLVGRFTLIICIAIGTLVLALIPVFFKARNYIVSIYSILQEMYTFELNFQSLKLEELEYMLNHRIYGDEQI